MVTIAEPLSDSPGTTGRGAFRRLGHRIQALLVNALYKGINGLLHGFAILLWPRPRPESAERVCVFRIGYIGDIVCALPAIRGVRRAYPNAKL
ncbi:MAG: hypothetical protein AAB150_01790, partial [Pseudomonadota bacterium]